MKKWVAMLLCMLLCLPLLAAAEDAQYTWYNDPAGRFSFAYPAAWTVVSKETMEDVMAVGEALADEELTALLDSMSGQLMTTDMVMLLSDNLTTNINLIPQEVGMEADGAQLLELGVQLQSMLAAQLPGIVFQQDPYLIELADGQSVMVTEYTYALAGYEMYGVQTMHTRGTTLYTLTLTSDPGNVQADVETLGLVLGSLRVE